MVKWRASNSRPAAIVEYISYFEEYATPSGSISGNNVIWNTF